MNLTITLNSSEIRTSEVEWILSINIHMYFAVFKLNLFNSRHAVIHICLNHPIILYLVLLQNTFPAMSIISLDVSFCVLGITFMVIVLSSLAPALRLHQQLFLGTGFFSHILYALLRSFNCSVYVLYLLGFLRQESFLAKGGTCESRSWQWWIAYNLSHIRNTGSRSCCCSSVEIWKRLYGWRLRKRTQHHRRLTQNRQCYSNGYHNTVLLYLGGEPILSRFVCILAMLWRSRQRLWKKKNGRTAVIWYSSSSVSQA